MQSSYFFTEDIVKIDKNNIIYSNIMIKGI